MLLTTTPTIDGRRITAYHGIVFGEVITGTGFVRDISASISDLFGLRSSEYENVLGPARENAIYEMTQQAFEKGANAVVGVKVDYEVLSGNMLMVSVSGTAVTAEYSEKE